MKKWEVVTVLSRAEHVGHGNWQLPKRRTGARSQPGAWAPQRLPWLFGHLRQVEHKSPTAASVEPDHRCSWLDVLAAALSSPQGGFLAQPAECDLMVGTLLTVCDHYALLGSLCHLPLPLACSLHPRVAQ